MSGMNDKIEIWAKDRYENVQLGSSDFANLAERILGSTPLKDE
jgi:DNA-binding transcriptional regulator/RsmH inhibitor MraZ